MDSQSPQFHRALTRFQRVHRWHRAFFVCALFCLTATAGALTYVLAQVGAANIGLRLSIAPIDGVTELPQGNGGGSGEIPSSAGGGGGSPQTLAQAEGEDDALSQIYSVPALPQSVHPREEQAGEAVSPSRTRLTNLKIGDWIISPDARGASAGSGSVSDNVVIVGRRPTFSGTVDVPYALVRVQVFSSQSYTSVVQADSRGRWLWAPPEDLEEGDHLLVIQVFDPEGEALLSEETVYFALVAEEGAAVAPRQTARIEDGGLIAARPALPPRASPASAEGDFILPDILFDLRVSIPKDYRVIKAGSSVVAQVSLINFSRDGRAQDVTLYYKIVNPKDETILAQSETVAVATRFAFIKSFSTSLMLPQGRYQLIVELPYEGVTAVSSDTFEVSEGAVVTLPGGASFGATLAMQTLVGFFLLFLMVLYFEFRRLDTIGGILRPIDEDDLKRLGYLS